MQTVSKQPESGNSSLEAMQGGFGDPVLQTQAIFRAIMEAMARPGTIMPLESDAMPPAPLYSLSGAILATLADADTPLWLSPGLSAEANISGWLTFHVGAPYAAEPAQASFAMLDEATKLPALEIFCLGEQDYPDRSTTLIIQVERLGNQGNWQLTGPGIKESARLGVEPVSSLFASQWALNNQLFPRGVDVILVAPDAIACLPRTTKISIIQETAHKER